MCYVCGDVIKKLNVSPAIQLKLYQTAETSKLCKVETNEVSTTLTALEVQLHCIKAG